MKTQTLNTKLGCFMREFVTTNPDKNLLFGYYKAGTKVWDTGTAGSKKLTKPQIRQLEKTGLVQFDWSDTEITIKSHVNVYKVAYAGEGPPYSTMTVEYTE